MTICAGKKEWKIKSLSLFLFGVFSSSSADLKRSITGYALTLWDQDTFSIQRFGGPFALKWAPACLVCLAGNSADWEGSWI